MTDSAERLRGISLELRSSSDRLSVVLDDFGPVGPGVPVRRGARLPYGWPLYALFLGFPLWWALGLGALIWPVLAVPLLAKLLVARPVRAPRGFGLWVLFLAWVGVSSIGLDGGSSEWIGFAYRMAIYLSMTVGFLFVYNAPAALLPARRVIVLLGCFWLVVVAGGWLGVALPTGGFSSITERLMPASLTENEFVYELVHPSFAQVHDFLGYPVARPKAPFVYTNDWGSNYALLFPLFLAAWWQTRRAGHRLASRLVVAASLVPVVISLNRGLWLSLGAGLAYVALRNASTTRGSLRTAGAVACAIALLLTLTPLRGVVSDRLATPHSNNGRETLYEQAVDLAMASPLVGYGAPQDVAGNKLLPDVGTQGQLWLVLVSQGVVGAGLFLGFLLGVTWRTRRVRTSASWCHVALVIGLVQLPVYDMLPSSLWVLLLCAGLGLREARV